VFKLAEGAKPFTVEELRVWAEDKMAHYKVPEFLDFVDAYPLTATGKVIKGELRKRYNVTQ
jgi:fatty-acyl-CoA synthase